MLYVERLGYQFAAMLVTLVCISYFASEIRINPTRDTFLVSQGKKADKVCICKFSHSILSETGKITHRFFDESMFSEDGLKGDPKGCKPFF